MKFTKIIAAFFAIFIMFSITGIAPSSAIDSADKPEIEKIIREYLLQNPQIINEMRDALEIKQREQLALAQTNALKNNAEAIFSSKNQAVVGKADAKYTVVEFFDYNCPYCQRAMNDMETVLKTNPDVKFVIKEWPVLGENSLQAHRVSIAFNNLYPDKYAKFHHDLLGYSGSKGADKAIEIAIANGADEGKLVQEMENPKVMDTLRENHSIANDLGITGTPSYVIGDQVVFGAIGVAELTRQLDALKAKN